MLALNSHLWTQKCSGARYVNGIVAIMNKVNLETPQSWIKSSVNERPTELLGAAKLHTSATRSRNLLQKMLGEKKKKKWYINPQPIQTGQSPFLKPAKKKNMVESQRIRTLNIIVYKAVSDMLASHEINADIPSYSVEITKVSFTPDFTSCRIYWKTSWSADKDSQIQQTLDKSAPRIRYLLISLQILSNVPPLVFVRDKKYAALKEVESLLETADYGPSEESGPLSLGGTYAETKQQSVEPLEKKKSLWFDIDHDALQKQIEDYKQQSRHTYSESSSFAGLTQKQLDLLAEIRKQKLIEKKKRKSKKLKDDDDLSPKAFLLARQLQKEEQEYSCEQGLEDSEVSEPMVDRKH